MQSYSLKRNILQFSGYVWAENEVIYVLYSVTPCISLFYTTILTATFLWSLLLFHTLPYCAFPVTHILVKDTMNSFLLFCLQQEKQRTRVKEKLDKCVKEKLVDFCDVLNIQINKAGTKKVSSQRNTYFMFVLNHLLTPCLTSHTLQEELSAKLLEFLESPHATTDVLLAEKEQVLSYQFNFIYLFAAC